MTFQPNTPIVNAGADYVNGLTIGTNGNNAEITVSVGAARDDTNTNDIISNQFLTINALTVGPNGCLFAPIVARTVYSVTLIGDSTGYMPTAAVALAYGTAFSFPAGYDLSRRIGWALSEGGTFPNIHFAKWYQVGNGLTRTYYYDTPLPAVVAGNATAYAIVPNTSTPAPGIVCPAVNSVAILQLVYNAAAASNNVQFRALASPGAVAGDPGIIRYGGGVATQNNSIEVPVIYDGSTGKSSFYYRVSSSSDTVNINAIGFYDVL